MDYTLPVCLLITGVPAEANKKSCYEQREKVSHFEPFFSWFPYALELHSAIFSHLSFSTPPWAQVNEELGN